LIHLSVPNQSLTHKKIDNKSLDVKVLVLYPYYVEADANGNSFDIKENDVRAIYNKHNKNVNTLWNRITKLGKKLPLNEIEALPNQKDHQQGVDHTVGHVVGEFELVEGEGGPFLFANLRVKGEENITKVEDGRFKKVSIGFDPKTHESFEISWVVNGAIPNAQNISFSDGGTLLSKKETAYNLNNLINLKSNLLSKYEINIKNLEEKENEVELSILLSNLLIDGKILPRDVLRIKSELRKILDKKVQLGAFNLINNNLRTVIDYNILLRNNLAIDFKGDFKMKNGKIDLEDIAIKSYAMLKKGAKFEEKEPMDENEKEKERIEKTEKKEDKKSSEFKHKDKKHIMKLAEEKDMEELGKYLSAFCSDEIENEENSAEKKEEKEKAKFSKEILDLKGEIAQFKKQNEEITAQLSTLSKGNDEARALFSKIVELQNTEKGE
jgi:hypothetical protein